VLKGKVQRQSDFPFFKPVMNAFKTILFGWGYGALLQRRSGQLQPFVLLQLFFAFMLLSRQASRT
jgi:hypothetical protein